MTVAPAVWGVADLAGEAAVLRADPAWHDVLRSRLGAFLCEASPTWTIDLEEDGPVPEDLRSPLAVRWEGCRIHGSAEAFTVTGETFTADVDLAAHRAVLRGPAAAYTLDALLRHLLPLVADDGLIVHGVMLGAEGRSWVCAGASGSGKSTLAKLLPERALCDELVALRRGADGWVARSLPFWEGRPGHGRLEGVALLRHGPMHLRREVGPARLVRELTEQMVWPLHDPAATAGCFHRLGDLAAEVPTYELEFVPRPGVWAVLSGEDSP